MIAKHAAEKVKTAVETKTIVLPLEWDMRLIISLSQAVADIKTIENQV